MSDPPAHPTPGSWTLKSVKIDELPANILQCLGNRYKAARRCYEWSGALPAASPTSATADPCFYFPNMQMPTGSGWEKPGRNWKGGFMVKRSELREKEEKKKAKSKSKNRPAFLDLLVTNPFDTEDASHEYAFKTMDLLPADMNSLEKIVQQQQELMQWTLYIRPQPIVNDLYAGYAEFIETAPSLPDFSAKLYICLDSATRTAFRHSDDIYIDIATMGRLMTSPIDFFKAQRDVPARDDLGKPIAIKIDSVINATQYRENVAVWKNIFVTSTGPGSYKPPRSINPNITLHLVLMHNNNIGFADFKTLVDAVQLAGDAPTAETKLRTKCQVEQTAPQGDYYQIGDSPFMEYSTYIEKSQWWQYLHERPPHPIPSGDQVTVATATMKTTLKENANKRAKDMLNTMTAKYPNLVKQTGTTVNHLTLLEAVDNPRSEHPSQAQVWGTSATTLAGLMNWHDDTVPVSDEWAPKPKFTLAEWLHRSAYSFGGIDLGSAGSSQVPQNLIFGTSETNSLMTRYETIWQEYLRKVGVAVPSNQTPPQGTFETLNPDQVDLKIFTAKDGQILDTQGVSATKTGGLDQAWLCYSLDCHFCFPTLGDIPGFKLPAKVWKSFYPFQRPFFTALEAAIDKSLLNYVFAKALGETPAPKDIVEIPASDTEPEPDPANATSGAM